MKDEDKELRMRISQLLDSDLDGRGHSRLIDKLETDADLKAAWSRYSLIGDVMRSTGGQLADSGFAEKVSAMVAEEPRVLAPKLQKSALIIRPSIMSLGLAASLAVVAILVGKSVNDHAEVFQTASYDRPSHFRVLAKASEAVENQADSRFNDYLVMHNESAYMAGSAGMLSYVRLVGSRQDR